FGAPNFSTAPLILPSPLPGRPFDASGAPSCNKRGPLLAQAGAPAEAGGAPGGGWSRRGWRAGGGGSGCAVVGGGGGLRRERGVERGREVGYQVVGVLDAAGEPDEPVGHVVPPLGAPVGGGVHAAEGGGRADQPALL